MYFSNFDLCNIVTPINWQILGKLLLDSGYPQEETKKVVHGFRFSFDLGYEGPQNRCSTAPNLPFTVGNKIILWNKLMKEVSLGRVAGPFDSIPFNNYIQSPIGLVPKDNGSQVRLIFHLSFNFKDGKSVNFHMPKERCSVKYHDLDEAVRCCLHQLQQLQRELGQTESPSLWFGKTDSQSAFRVLPLSPKCWKWVVMMARDPVTQEEKFFVDKCLPFRASISCALFQSVSDALRHILEFRISH